jgi:hypothetical protein
MERLSVKLGAALGLQLVLAAMIWGSGSDNGAFKAKDPLLAFDPAKIDRIEIGEDAGKSVVLVKKDGAWIIPAMADFPAEGTKVDGLLAKLAGLKKGWPVASSFEAAKRFKVTGEMHERRIVLESGGSAAGEILIGTSPTFRQAHIRAANDSNIYSAAFALYDAGSRGEDWIDRNLLNLPQDKIASISIGGITLEQKDGKFALSGLAEGEKQDDTAINRLVGALTYPAFDAVMGKGPDALAKLDQPAIAVMIKKTDGSATVLKYKPESEGGIYLFASSANGYVFRVSEASIEPVVKAKRETLIQAPKKPDAEKAEAATLPAQDAEPQPANGGGG